jgi:hypothetical protein
VATLVAVVVVPERLVREATALLDRVLQLVLVAVVAVRAVLGVAVLVALVPPIR